MSLRAIRSSLLIGLLTFVAAIAGAQGMIQPIKFTATPEVTKAAPNQDVLISLKATIDKTWHLYSSKKIEDGPVPTTITIADGPVQLSGEIQNPTPEVKMDPNFGKEVEFFADSAEYKVPVRVKEDAKGEITGVIKVRFQACDDRRCLPPKTVEVPFKLTIEGAPIANATPLPAAGTTGPVKVQTDAKNQGLLAFLGIAVSAGLLALLTPCVFPMIPITVSVFSKQKKEAGWKAGIGQALAFCAGIIGTFTVVGIIVALIFGASGVQKLATSPIVNLGLAALFFVLALNLFGVFEIGLPSSWANKINPRGKSGIAAPILMGLVFTLTSFTCTMPFVGTLLVSASQGDLLYPIVGMLAFSTTFAFPFFLLALFPQAASRLPKSGGWLATVKAFLGFIELAAAVKFVSNVDLVWQLNLMSRPVFLAVWACIFMVAGLFLLGALNLPKLESGGRPGPGRLVFGLATVACAVWFLGAINGRAIGELEAFLPPDNDTKWATDYEKALVLAKETGKPLLIDFTGVTCTNCRWMEKNMFPRKSVEGAFENFILVKLLTDRELPGDVANQALQQKLTGSVTLPIYAVVSPEGKPLKIYEGAERDESKFVGFLESGVAAFKGNSVAAN